MCIAVIKPKNVEMPSEKVLKNCFDSNPHGAGFMFSDGQKLIIKKGFMNFNAFYTALKESNLTKEQLVFLHFRIATHGLRDGGNTHPFPISGSVNDLRKTNYEWDGYGLIHNGIMHYTKNEFVEFDPTEVISDTMLFSMKLNHYFEIMKKSEDAKTALMNSVCIENLFAFRMFTGNERVEKNLNEYIGWNKVAIMGKDESFITIGDWIEDNGMLYSNNDYKDSIYDYTGWYSNNYGTATTSFSAYTYVRCVFCDTHIKKVDSTETMYGPCCDACKKESVLVTCTDCGELSLKEHCEDGVCIYCHANDYKCDGCRKKVTYLRTVGEKLFCSDCYNKMIELKKTEKQ